MDTATFDLGIAALDIIRVRNLIFRAFRNVPLTRCGASIVVLGKSHVQPLSRIEADFPVFDI